MREKIKSLDEASSPGRKQYHFIFKRSRTAFSLEIRPHPISGFNRFWMKPAAPSSGWWSSSEASSKLGLYCCLEMMKQLQSISFDCSLLPRSCDWETSCYVRYPRVTPKVWSVSPIFISAHSRVHAWAKAFLLCKSLSYYRTTNDW